MSGRQVNHCIDTGARFFPQFTQHALHLDWFTSRFYLICRAKTVWKMFKADTYSCVNTFSIVLLPGAHTAAYFYVHPYTLSSVVAIIATHALYEQRAMRNEVFQS